MFLTLSFLLLSSISIAIGGPTFISVSNGARWGRWGDIARCPPGTVSKGFALKIEGKQWSGDDTAVNGIRLYCQPRDANAPQTIITPSQGLWGSWTFPFFCSSGYLVSFSMKVEPPQGSGDDTAVNNFKFRCSNGQEIEGVGLPWGSYGGWSDSCTNGICGVKTKIEPPQGLGDDTALNDAIFYCC
uniref:Vitelline membrane outer layer protein 1 n=1 Tax=Leptobrachium leishanense TaxID=445787 RepID=A0A8C5Q3A6_9ANUR